MALIFPDRVIAVRGSVENMSKAEAAISVLLRECIEKDSHSVVREMFCACYDMDIRNMHALVSFIIYLLLRCHK